MAITLEELAAQYGYAAAFFNSDPELKKLIDQATQGQWTADRFRAAFMATNWYKWRSVAERQWVELEARDPKEAWKRVGEQELKLKQRMSRDGVNFPPERIREFARNSLMWGWSEEQVSQAIEAEYQYRPGESAGGTAALETKIKQSAADYGIGVTDAQFDDWLGGVLGGRYTEDNLNDFMRDMARSKYPGISERIDQGFTVRQIAAPYVQSYANILEVDEGAVKMTDPSIQKALQGTPPPDGKTGPQMQTVYQFEQQLRKDPRWLQTKNARQSTMDATLGVLKDWGIVA